MCRETLADCCAAPTSQVIDSITRLSSNLRNAADVCDNFVRIVARSNPVAVASILGQPGTGRGSDFGNFLAGGTSFLNTNGTSGGASLPQQAAQQQQPGLTPGAATTASGQQQHTAQTGSGAQQLPPGLGPDDVDANGKKLSKRQKKLLRKARDPDAPKRPPSAYLLFQNEVRADMRERFPDMPYKEILGKVSEAWKNLSEVDRKIYQDKTNEEMKRWTVEKKDHEANGLPFGDDQDDYANSSALIAAAAEGSNGSNASSGGVTRGAGNTSSSSAARRTDIPPTPDTSRKRKDPSSTKKEKRSRQ